MTDKKDRPLPELRNDLKIYMGSVDWDGSPSYSLHDPLNETHYKISWADSLIFQHYRPGMKIDDLIREIKKNAPIDISPHEIERFYSEASLYNLLKIPVTSEHIKEQKKAKDKKKNAFLNWIYSKFFQQIRLVNPDKWLEKMLPHVSILATRTAFITYALLGIISLLIIATKFEDYFATLKSFSDPINVFFLLVAIFMVKVCHELAHAFVAKSFGVEVRSMGVAVVLFFPFFFYTDVSDAWKLWNRKQKIIIASAGIITEIVIASLATIAWALTPPGLLNSIFFIISSVNWVTTILINTNPALKLDGYQILSELIRFDNLKPRSNAFAKWKLKNLIAEENLPPPEMLDKKLVRFLIGYSIFSYFFQIAAFILIAYFIYQSLPAVIGPFLAFIMIYVGIISPIINEITIASKEFHMKKKSLFFKISASLLGLLFLWYALPYPHTENFPAITVPKENQVFYVPFDSKVEKVYVQDGQKVAKGDPIAELKSASLEHLVKSKEVEAKILEIQIKSISFSNNNKDSKLIAYLPSKQAELKSIKIELDRLRSQLDKLNLVAEVDGTVHFKNELLKPNTIVGANVEIGDIKGKKQVDVLAFVPEEKIDLVQMDSDATFVAQNTSKRYLGKVTEINQTKTAVLQYPSLASIYKGPLLVKEPTQKNEKNLVLLNTYYNLTVDLSNQQEELHPDQTGYVKIRLKWHSKLYNTFAHFYNLITQQINN